MPVLLALVLLALLPSVAAAGTAQFIMVDPQGPTVWDGADRVIALHGRDVMVQGPGPRRRLATLPPLPGTRGNESGAVSASPRWVLVRRERRRYDRQGPLEEYSSEITLVAADGTTTRLDGCDRPVDRWPWGGGADLDGDLVAWTDMSCTEERYVTVRDLATAEQRRIDVAGPVGVEVGGDWIALHGENGIAVHHRGGAQPTYSLPREPRATSVTLAPDGSILACLDRRIHRATASAPELKPIPGADGCSQDIEAAGGRVAWTRSFDLHGRDVTLVSAPLDGSAPPEQMMDAPGWLVGFDGTRALVGIRDDCTGRSGFAIAGDPAAPPEPPSTCPVMIGDGPLRLRAGRKVKLPVSCPRGCFIRGVSVVVRRPVTLVASRIWFRVRPGDRFVRVHVPKRFRRLLARTRRVSVSVDVTDRCCGRVTRRTLELR